MHTRFQQRQPPPKQKQLHFINLQDTKKAVRLPCMEAQEATKYIGLQM